MVLGNLKFVSFVSEGIFSCILPAGNGPGSHACMDVWRLPQGSKTPPLCGVAGLIPHCLRRGF